MNKKQTRYIKPFSQTEQGVTILSAIVSIQETLDATKWKQHQYIKVAQGIDVRKVSQGLAETKIIVKSCCKVLKDLRHFLKNKDTKVSEYQIKQMSLDLAAAYEDLP